MVKRYAHFTHQHLQQYVDKTQNDVPTRTNFGRKKT
jgi:hypothetical protein